MIRSIKGVSCNRVQIHHFCSIPTHPNLKRAFLALLLKEESKKRTSQVKYFVTKMKVPLLWQRLIQKYGPQFSHFRHAILKKCVVIYFGFLCWPGANYCLS